MSDNAAHERDLIEQNADTVEHGVMALWFFDNDPTVTHLDDALRRADELFAALDKRDMVVARRGALSVNQHCADEGFGHLRWQHNHRTGRCMEGAMRSTSAWRCTCHGFVEPNGPLDRKGGAPAVNLPPLCSPFCGDAYTHPDGDRDDRAVC